MRYFIAISFLLLYTAGSLQSQTSFADSLLRYEYNYFKCKNDSTRQELLLKKISLYLGHNLMGKETFNEIKRVNAAHIKNGHLRENFLWNASIISYLNNETEYCRHFAAEYGQLTNDTSVAYGLLLVLANKYSDTTLVRSTMEKLVQKDSTFSGLDCFAKLSGYNRKHRKFYIISSAVVPGSGTVMNGAVVKGLVSFALSAGSVYGVYELVRSGLYANAFLWGAGVGAKFYNGNIKLTEKVFEQKEMKQKNKLAVACELTLKEILAKYPLVIKDK